MMRYLILTDLELLLIEKGAFIYDVDRMIWHKKNATGVRSLYDRLYYWSVKDFLLYNRLVNN